MQKPFRAVCAVLLFFVIGQPCFTQQGGTGTPAFGSFGGGPDVINLGSLNAFLPIPIRHKAGRGMDFDYSLSYNSSFWFPAIVNGSKAWQPISQDGATWGWNGLATVGQVYADYPMTYTQGTCGQFGNSSYQEWSFGLLTYYDEHGVTHSFTGTGGTYYSSPGGNYCPPNGANPSGTMRAADTYGWVAYFSLSAGAMQVVKMVRNDGTVVNPPVYVNYSGATSSSTSTDGNGNQITMSNGVYTDTLGQTALSIVGTAPSNTLLSFLNKSGGYSNYTVTYASHNIKTNFGCSGVAEYNASNVSLVNSITLPDGRSYQFTYEGTPSYSGYTTGRVASIILPTGGTISYTYVDGNNGIVCADGTIAGLVRTTPDGATRYDRSGSGINWTTTITAPAYQGVSDQTVINFLHFGYDFFEIERSIYAGTSTLMETVLHCYEQNDSNCSSTTGDNNAQFGGTVARLKITFQLPDSSGVSSGTLDTYDTLGNNTLHEVHDYGTGGVYGSLLQQTITTYSSSYSSSQQEVPTEVTVKDGATPTPNQISDTQYSYTATTTATSGTPQHVSGSPTLYNLSSIKQWVSGTTYLTKSFTYFDTGKVQTATDVNGGQTTYAYGNCGNSFPSSVSSQTGGSVVTSLSTSATWDCTGGVPLTTGDVNGNTTTYAYGSEPYWRPTSVTNNATGAITNFSYPSSSSNSSSSSMSFNNGSSTATSVLSYDTLGRTILQQKQQAPGSSNYDTIAIAYDSRGRIASTTLPYSGSLGSYVPTNPGASTTYDALNRTYVVSDSGGGTKQYNFSPNTNDLLITVGPQVTTPAAENLKKRNLEYNGAGWLTSVCEVVTSTQPAGGACGQAVGYTGYLTKYSYDGGGRLTKVQQNAQSSVQTRTISYDGLSRKTSELIPEWSAGTGTAGSGAYTYDSDSSGSCSGSYPGDLVKSIDNMGNVTCHSYDLLHRPLSSTITSSSPYYSVTPNAYFVYDAATYNGSVPMQNAKGTLAEAYTCSGSCGPKLTDELFSTTPVTSGAMAGGVQVQMWQTTPHLGGYYLTTEIYYPNSVVGSISSCIAGPCASIGLPNITFGVDGEGRPYSASDGTHNLVTATAYNPASAATQVTYGNASTGLANDVDSFSYNSSTYRPANLTYSVSPSSGTFTVSTALTWNANGSLQKMIYTDGSPNPMSQTCTYSTDDLSRIASVDCGSSAWGQNFSYDPFGNIQKSVPPGRTGTTYQTGGYSAITNQAATGATYDKNGNQLTSTPATLTWNAWNVPVTVGGVSGTYDAFGRLVEYQKNCGYTDFVFRPSGSSLALYSCGLVKGTVPLPGGGTAIYNSSGLNYIRHKDWLGSSRLGTTWAHTVYSKEAYAPFGETYNESGTPDRSFTGEDQDVVTGSGGTGVYDNLFRKYDPSAGRWLSPDPLGWEAASSANPQSLNRYAYVLNNPLSLVDPNGLDCVYLDDAGVSVESIDNNSDSGQCNLSGGYWAPGSVPDSSWVTIPGDGSAITIESVYGGNSYWTTATSMVGDGAAMSQTPGWGTGLAATDITFGVSFAFLPGANFDPGDPGYQLAIALGRNGAYTVNNVCFVGGFFAASAVGATASIGATYIPTALNAAAESFPGNLLEFGIKQMFNAVGKTPSGFWNALAALPTVLPLDAEAMHKGCSRLH